MGTNVAGSWQKAVKFLEECNTKQTGTIEAEAALRRVHDSFAKLRELPTPPKAVWKKLVQQLQVCCSCAHVPVYHCLHNGCCYCRHRSCVCM
jgi:hypothetical protein